MRKLFQFFDKKFFLFITLVFFGIFGAGLVFSSDELKGLNSGDFKKLVNWQFEKEERDDTPGEQTSEGTSQDVLGEETEKEATAKEIFVEEKASLSTDAVDLGEKAKTAVSQLTEVLEKNDFSSLYKMLGEDLKGTFGEEEFSQALATGLKIEKTKIFSGPQVSGEWSEAVLELTLSDGSKKQFMIVFHWEDGVWKLFGTEELH